MKKSDAAKLLQQLEHHGYTVDLYVSATTSHTIVVNRSGEVVRDFSRAVDALTWLDAKLDTLRDAAGEGDV